MSYPIASDRCKSSLILPCRITVVPFLAPKLILSCPNKSNHDVSRPGLSRRVDSGRVLPRQIRSNPISLRFPILSHSRQQLRHIKRLRILVGRKLPMDLGRRRLHRCPHARNLDEVLALLLLG